MNFFFLLSFHLDVSTLLIRDLGGCFNAKKKVKSKASDEEGSGWES